MVIHCVGFLGNVHTTQSVISRARGMRDVIVTADVTEAIRQNVSSLDPSAYAVSFLSISGAQDLIPMKLI
ncbi:unnamed protein product, partial [Iphiclides podalirius]